MCFIHYNYNNCYQYYLISLYIFIDATSITKTKKSPQKLKLYINQSYRLTYTKNETYNFLQYIKNYQQPMRPKSAVSRRKLTTEKKSDSKTKKKQPYNASYSSVSRVESRYTTGTHKWQIKTQKLKVCKDAKSIALIHAYQPKRLKQCIVSDPKSYQRFYNNFGQCQLANLYTKSFLKHFKEWRRNIRQRISNVVSMLSQTKEQIKPQQVKMVLQQLQGITQQLKSATASVLKTKDAQDSKGARDLFENFEHMEDYIKKLVQIVRHLCQYISQINKLLQQGAYKSQQQSLRDIQKRVKKLHKEYERKLIEPLHFCTSHPESTFMNRTQYKMKLKFDHIAREAIKILQEIFKLTNILQNFQDKFHTYTDKNIKAQQFTVDVLQQIATLINTYQQYKLKDKSYIPEQQNQITKSNQVLLKLKTKINSEIRLFLDTFRQKSYQLLQYQLKQLQKERVVDAIKNYANRFKICKKKILTLSKIFNKYNYPGYYEVLTNVIKQTSQSFQNVGELVEQMMKMSNNKKTQNRDRICRVIQSVLPYVSKYQQNRSKICNSISSLIIDKSQDLQQKNRYPYSYSQQNQLQTKQRTPQSKKLTKFLQIMHFSQNQTQQLLSIPHYPVKQASHIITNQQVEKVVESNIQQVYRLSREVFPNAHKNSIQLNKLINDELINKFVAFADDIMRESIHSFQVFQEFYSKMYGNEAHHEKKIHKDSIKNMLDYFKQTMEKFNAYKNSSLAKKFLQWMFENKMAMHVINNMRKLDKIFNDPLNKQYWSSADKLKKNNLCYRKNDQIKQYMQQKKQLLREIVDSSSAYVRQKSLFDYYFTESLGKINLLIQNQLIYQNFDNSVQTGEYWPTFSMLAQWDDLQFDYYIDESLSASIIKQKRKKIYEQLIKYIQKIIQLTQSQQQKKSLGNKFVEQSSKKIQNIKQLLIPFTKKNIKSQQSSQKVKNYKEVSKSIMNYLLNNNIYHVGLLTNSQQPILFVNQKQFQNYESILQALQKRLKLDPYTLERDQSKSKFIQFNTQKILKQLKQLFTIKKQNQPQFLLQQKNQNKSKAQRKKQQKKSPSKSSNIVQQLMEQLIQQENNYEEEVFDEEIEEQNSLEEDGLDMVESIMQETQNMRKTKSKDSSAGLFILQNPNVQKQQRKNIGNSSFIMQKQKNTEEFYKIPQSYSSSVYYKIKQLINLNKVNQCLKAAKNQSDIISKNVQIQKLVLGFQKQQPNRELVDHLNTIISQTSDNNFMTILNKNNKLTKNQQVFQKLKQTLLDFSGKSSQSTQNELVNKKQKALAEVLNKIGCKYQYLYTEGQQGNQIILCQLANKDGYIHAILNNANPIAGQLISEKNGVQIQKLFLNSLLTLPYQKNRSLQQIVEQIKICNQQIKNKYKLLKDGLEIYKKQDCKIINKSEIDKKIQEYYRQKTYNQRLFSIPVYIDYESYKTFMMEYQQIYNTNSQNKTKLCKIILNNNKDLPIFISKNQEQTKPILLNTILPSRYGGSAFVERTTLESVNIKYGDILKNILNTQLNGYRDLQSAEVFDMVYGCGYGGFNNIQAYKKQREDQIQRLLQKFHKLFVSDNDNGNSNSQDFLYVANLGKVVGIPQHAQIIEKINHLQGQMQLLQKIACIQTQSATFLLQNNSQIQKQSQFLQNVDESASFILEKQAQKVQIPSYILQELNELLNKIKMSHWTILYKNSIIGLAQGNLTGQMAIKRCLNIKQTENLKWKQKKRSNEAQKIIQVEELPLYLSISNRINQNILKERQKITQKVLQNHYIQINNENTIQTVIAINKMHERPVIVQCKYPRRPVEIKLKKKINNENQNNKNTEIATFITKFYNYGSKYNLIAFQNEIIKDLLAQYEKARIQQERIRIQQQKRRIQQQERKRKLEEERLRIIQEQKRKKQQEQIRKKVFQEQIRKRFQEQQRQRQQKLRKQRQQLERLRMIKEQQEERIRKAKQQEEHKQKIKEKKKQKKKSKAKKIILKNKNSQDQLQLYYNFSEDDRRQVSFSKIVWNKNQKVNINQPQKKKGIKGNEKLSTESQEQQLSEMSIVLSQNNGIERQELIMKNKCYKFTDVKDIIDKNKPKFILDE